MIENLFKKVDSLTRKREKIYIVPTKNGLWFTFVIFTLFLIGLTYANNFTLLICFSLFSLFILIMFETHSIMEKCKVSHIEFIPASAEAPYQLSVNLPLDLPVEIEVITEKKNIPTSKVQQSDTGIGLFKLRNLSRGKYRGKFLKYYTKGHYQLFYVWSYKAIDQEFYIYPSQTPSSLHESASDNQLLYYASDEFSHHTHYQYGMQANRIDWKIYAKSGGLYTKLFSEDKETGILVDYFRFSEPAEERISKMAYLVEKAYRNKYSWQVKSPTVESPLDKGNEHYHLSMRLLSEI